MRRCALWQIEQVLTARPSVELIGSSNALFGFRSSSRTAARSRKPNVGFRQQRRFNALSFPRTTYLLGAQAMDSVLKHVTGPYSLIALALLVLWALARQLGPKDPARRVFTLGLLGLSAVVILGALATLLRGAPQTRSDSAERPANQTKEVTAAQPPREVEPSDPPLGSQLSPPVAQPQGPAPGIQQAAPYTKRGQKRAEPKVEAQPSPPARAGQDPIEPPSVRKQRTIVGGDVSTKGTGNRQVIGNKSVSARSESLDQQTIVQGSITMEGSNNTQIVGP
jgi:hypothetical protein